jgi:hypothetical protein
MTSGSDCFAVRVSSKIWIVSILCKNQYYNGSASRLAEILSHRDLIGLVVEENRVTRHYVLRPGSLHVGYVAVARPRGVAEALATSVVPVAEVQRKEEHPWCLCMWP